MYQSYYTTHGGAFEWTTFSNLYVVVYIVGRKEDSYLLSFSIHHGDFQSSTKLNCSIVRVGVTFLWDTKLCCILKKEKKPGKTNGISTESDFETVRHCHVVYNVKCLMCRQIY